MYVEVTTRADIIFPFAARDFLWPAGGLFPRQLFVCSNKQHCQRSLRVPVPDLTMNASARPGAKLIVSPCSVASSIINGAVLYMFADRFSNVVSMYDNH